MSMLGFEKTPDEVIKRLKALGRESFEEYARGMEEKWKAVNFSPFKCPGAAAAAEAEVFIVSELLAYCRKEHRYRIKPGCAKHDDDGSISRFAESMNINFLHHPGIFTK